MWTSSQSTPIFRSSQTPIQWKAVVTHVSTFINDKLYFDSIPSIFSWFGRALAGSNCFVYRSGMEIDVTRRERGMCIRQQVDGRCQHSLIWDHDSWRGGVDPWLDVNLYLPNILKQNPYHQEIVVRRGSQRAQGTHPLNAPMGGIVGKPPLHGCSTEWPIPTPSG